MNCIKDIIKSLRNKIELYEYFYNVLNISIISDQEYDKLIEELTILEKKYYKHDSSNSPTKKIGKNFSNELKIRNHIFPMLSLESVYNINNFYNFYSFVKKNNSENNLKLCCELKIDGVALSILYKYGKLVHALTRGDGYSGEDVTHNLNIIKNVPNILLGENVPEVLEVRGEVFMLKSDFNSLNNSLKRKTKKIFSNIRNIVSGTLRRTNICKTSKFVRRLFFCVYGYGFAIPNNCFVSHYKMLQKMKSFGFSINKYNVLHKNKKKILNFFKKSFLMKNKINFETDGIVIKTDSINLQKQLGYNNKFPKWAIAIKFDTENLITKVLKITFEIGRTGILTPVASLNPINFSGVVVKNVSLYNINQMKRLGIKIGSHVLVKRSGNVIPKIVRVINSTKTYFKKNILLPVNCPSCKSKLFLNNCNKLYRCLNRVFCAPQKEKLILHFFSKNALNIRGIGPKIIKKLVFKGIVNSPLDIFSLNKKTLCQIENINEKSANNIINRLNNSKKVYFANFIYALGIPEIGLLLSKNISKHFSSIEELIHSDYVDFLKIKKIGKKNANNLMFFFKSKNNIKYIKKLSKILKIIF
ncbi:NAD-dependent DNA ligase LigA [Buchnera aphidicola (Chaitoregma tattakana)]|uniref:NAD-dependent DNA ligase LigA n=1 Tax=Buchnera aphidicola TaxID=9 RepID=UPI0031B81F7C